MSSSSSKTTDRNRKPPLLLLFRMTVVAAATPLMVRAGLPRLQRWLEPRGVAVSPLVGATSQGGQYAQWVDAVIRRGQPVVRPGCLTRGVTLYYLLRREGADVSLCFGVGPVDGEMAGHCWLELDGLPVLEPNESFLMFTPVARVSRSGVTQ